MNVFMKDRFICLGVTEKKIHHNGADWVRFEIRKPLPLILNLTEKVELTAMSCMVMSCEDYDIGRLYHNYPGSLRIEKTFMLKIDPETQTPGPLELKPWCDVSWFVGY